MKTRGLIQRPWQVRGFLAGRRTQVRVPIKGMLPCEEGGVRFEGDDREFEEPHLLSDGRWVITDNRPPDILADFKLRCPLGAPGDVLWIREAIRGKYLGWGTWRFSYDADGEGVDMGRYRSNLGDKFLYIGKSRLVQKAAHMPKWAARLHCRVLDARAHLVREISADDAVAEGAYRELDPLSWSVNRETWHHSPKAAHRAQWEADYGPGSWERDWCFAATVERVESEAA